MCPHNLNYKKDQVPIPRERGLMDVEAAPANVALDGQRDASRVAKAGDARVRLAAQASVRLAARHLGELESTRNRQLDLACRLCGL